MAGAIATRFSPSFRLIGAHFALGVAGLCAFSAGLAWRADAIRGHFFQPVLLGLVHLCVLGWLLPIAIGALHQLVPVLFEVPSRSERLAWGALALYSVGSAGMIGHFWTFATGFGLVASAGLLLAAIGLYVLNLLATLAQAKEVTLTGFYVIAALCYLLLAASLGFALAWNLHRPYLYVDHVEWLRAHAHAAAAGFFGLLIMGVAYRLLEMFLLSHGAPARAGWVALVAMNAALACMVANFVFGRVEALAVSGLAAATVGVGAFLLQVRAIFVRRMRKTVDTAWRHTAASLAYLALSLALGGALLFAGVPDPWRERLELAYGLLALPGFIGSIVVGQLYKILPFLVWFHRFSAYVGLKKVKAASELLPEAPQRVQWALMHAGLALLAGGVIADAPAARLAGASLFAASAALFTRNLAVVWRSRP